MQEDAAAVAAIYGQYVQNSYATFDLVAPSVRVWDERIAAVEPGLGHHFLVAEGGGELLGYAYSTRFRPKAAYVHTVEVSVYTARPGHGLGNLLYDSLFGLVGQGPVHRVHAGIALPNEASVKLHERFGFTHVGTLTEVGRKFDRWWDVAYYEKRVGP